MQKKSSLIDFRPGILDGTKIENIRVGNSYFFDDVWDFTGLEHTNSSSSELLLKFSHITKNDIRLVVKQYMAIALLKQKISGAKRALVAFNRFQAFLDDSFPHISSLEEVTPMVIRTYYYHLHTATSMTYRKPLSRTSLFHCGAVIKNILLEGNLRQWLVPKECNWVIPLYDEMIVGSARTKNDRKTTKIMYSDEIIQAIIKSALEDDCPFTKAAIIIQSQVGLRLGEILMLRPDCIKKDNKGHYQLECWTSKTKKGLVSRVKPANEMVAEAIEELLIKTASLRQEPSLNYLFIHRSPNGQIIRCEEKNWNRDYMRKFVKRWDIKEGEKLIHLSSHYFRHIFATYAHRKGMPIQSIMKMFDHESLIMTNVYTHIEEDDMKAKFAEMFSEGAIIAGLMADKINERLQNDNPFQGRTQKEINAIMDAMRIHVTANGMCFHHPARRDACADDGDCLICPNFVTTELFLPVHEQRIKKLEAEMERATVHGNTLWYAKNKEIRDRIISQFINPMKEQIQKRNL